VVLVGEDGQVENRVLTLAAGGAELALTEASNFLNARIRGRTRPRCAPSSKRRWRRGAASSTS